MKHEVPTLDEMMAADDRRRFLLKTKKMILESKDDTLTFDGNSTELYDYWKLNEGGEVTVELREAP